MTTRFQWLDATALVARSSGYLTVEAAEAGIRTQLATNPEAVRQNGDRLEVRAPEGFLDDCRHLAYGEVEAR